MMQTFNVHLQTNLLDFPYYLYPLEPTLAKPLVDAVMVSHIRMESLLWDTKNIVTF